MAVFFSAEIDQFDDLLDELDADFENVDINWDEDSEDEVPELD